MTLTEEISSCTGVLTSGQTSSLTFLARAAMDPSISELLIVVWQPGSGFCSSHCMMCSQYIITLQCLQGLRICTGSYFRSQQSWRVCFTHSYCLLGISPHTHWIPSRSGLVRFAFIAWCLAKIHIHPPDSDSQWLTMSTSMLAVVLVRLTLLDMLLAHAMLTVSRSYFTQLLGGVEIAILNAA